MLEEFLGRPKVAERLAKDYVDLAIDTERMTGGQELFDALRGKRSGGLPWLVVLDADGKELITGVSEQGNIGAPVQPAECAHFVKMIQTTKKRLTDDDVRVIEAELEEHAKGRRRG